MLITGTTYSVSHYKEFEKTGNKDIFEDIIDSMIMDGIAGMNESFRRAISSLPKDKKRLAILSILDKDRNLFAKIKESITDINLSKIDHVKNIILMLREYVKIAEVEKKKFGEVMTPLDLVKEMLNTLPAEVWSNPNLKWLDPANGTGPFPAVVIYKLMKGLESWEPDADKRYKHIIENMIYVCELQPKNMFLYLCTVDPKDELACNIYTGSFLEEGFDYHMKNVWSVDKFDIVIGNPPYNSGQNASGKRGGGDTLWDKFVIKSINNMVENGYLLFVHPTLWRKPQSEKSSTKLVSEIMMKKQIHYLEMHDSSDGMKVFGAGTRYDFYLLENTTIYKETLINGEDRTNVKVDLSNYNFIPNSNLDFFNKIKANDGDDKCTIIFNATNYETRKKWVSSEQNDEFRYRLVHSTPKGGTRYMYSSRNDNGHFGISKVIFGDSGIYDVIIDMNGELGMTQHSMAIEVKSVEEANNIKNALLSKDFSDFLKTVMWSNFQIDWRLFSFLKKDFWKEFIKE